VSELLHTARFFCTTDLDQNQIASFYAGAMSEAREIELAPLASASGVSTWSWCRPTTPKRLLRHTAEARDLGVPFVADPSQQLALLEGEQVKKLVDAASSCWPTTTRWR